MVKPRLGFEELFEEFLKSSHLRDELVMLFGVCHLKVFVVKNSCVYCADVMNVFLLHLSIVI